MTPFELKHCPQAAKPLDIVKRLRSEAENASPDLVREAAKKIVWCRKELGRLKVEIARLHQSSIEDNEP